MNAMPQRFLSLWLCLLTLGAAWHFTGALSLCAGADSRPVVAERKVSGQNAFIKLEMRVEYVKGNPNSIEVTCRVTNLSTKGLEYGRCFPETNFRQRLINRAGKVLSFTPQGERCYGLRAESMTKFVRDRLEPGAHVEISCHLATIFELSRDKPACLSCYWDRRGLHADDDFAKAEKAGLLRISTDLTDIVD